MAKEIVETPLMKQYIEMKARHPDAILLFRVGDFYETFSDDALVASEILGITLTRRANGAAQYGVTGFPHHALDTYLPKLVRAGKRVAILPTEQMKTWKLTKKLVKRGITELVTPGVSINDNILDHRENNFLAGVHFGKGKQSGWLFSIYRRVNSDRRGRFRLCGQAVGQFLSERGAVRTHETEIVRGAFRFPFFYFRVGRLGLYRGCRFGSLIASLRDETSRFRNSQYAQRHYRGVSASLFGYYTAYADFAHYIAVFVLLEEAIYVRCRHSASLELLSDRRRGEKSLLKHATGLSPRWGHVCSNGGLSFR